jgi:outer membrane receptor protein involved in Fe transport
LQCAAETPKSDPNTAASDAAPSFQAGAQRLLLALRFRADDVFLEAKPTTLRFDVVNLFDSVYEIRDGSGIGVFAPQFGPRRGFYVGISQKL